MSRRRGSGRHPKDTAAAVQVRCATHHAAFRGGCPRENGAQGGGSRYLIMLYALAPASENRFLNNNPQAEVSNANTPMMQPKARMHRRRTTISRLASPRHPKPIANTGRSATIRNG